MDVIIGIIGMDAADVDVAATTDVDAATATTVDAATTADAATAMAADAVTTMAADAAAAIGTTDSARLTAQVMQQATAMGTMKDSVRDSGLQTATASASFHLQRQLKTAATVIPVTPAIPATSE